MKKISFILIVFSFILLAGCAAKEEAEINKVYQGSPTETATDTEENKLLEGSPEATNINENTDMSKFDQTAMPEKGDKIIVMDTTKGTIKIRLFPEFAPKTVENFIGLAEKGYYNGIIFHRVIPDFMIQGGDPEGTGRGGVSLWGGKFNDEFNPNLKNLRGALSMANSGPNTNGSQFFIVQKQGGTSWLDGKHTVFGQVFEGMDVVDAIATAERDAFDKPLTDIKMESVAVETY
jgi:peptidyl-prolyl cis-trans isomerase B (cyclophilin B)